MGTFDWHVPCRLLREMVRDYCGISYEAWHTTNATNNLSLASEKRTTAANTKPSRSTSEISNTGSLLARMRCQVTFTPDTVFENQRTSKVYRVLIKQKRLLLRKSTSISLVKLLCLKWRIGDIHIWVLSLVDESSYDLEITLDLHQ